MVPAAGPAGGEVAEGVIVAGTRHAQLGRRAVMTDTADLLAGVPLLSGLDRKHLETLARDFSERTFPAGTVVVRQGDEHGIGFFVVAEGEGVVSVDGQ
jgi:CRP-like cAMP-binding protein